MLKKSTTLVVLLLCINTLFSQNLYDIIEPQDTNYYTIYNKVLNYLSQQQGIAPDTVSTGEDGLLSNFKRFNKFYRNRVNENGSMSSSTKELQRIVREFDFGCDPIHNERWENLGPFDIVNHKQDFGRVNAISVNKNDVNNILIGGANGGVWKSDNGGQTWVNTTDDDGFSIAGIKEFVRHPLDQDIIYAATKNHFTTFGKFERDEMGIGIIVSKDGGESWELSKYFKEPFFKHSEILSLAIEPDIDQNSNTTLYVGTPTQIHKYVGDEDLMDNSWSSYNDFRYIKIPDILGGYVEHQDLLVVNDFVWFTNRLGVYKLDPSTMTAIQITNFDFPSDPFPDLANDPCAYYVGDATTKIIENPNLLVSAKLRMNRNGEIFVMMKPIILNTDCSAKYSKFPVYIFRTDNEGDTWTTEYMGLDPLNKELHFDVSPYNSNTFYFEALKKTSALRKVRKSTDFGKNSAQMGNVNNIHPDVRGVEVYGGSQTSSLNDTIFYVNDGGVTKTINGFDWDDVSGNGLALTNYYGVGVLSTDSKFYVAGAQDNSAMFYNNGTFYYPYDRDEYFGDNGDVVMLDSFGTIKLFQQSQSWVAREDKINTSDFYLEELSKKEIKNFSYLSPEFFSMPQMLINPMNPSELFIPQQGGVALERNYGDMVGQYTIRDLTKHGDDLISAIAIPKSDGDILFYATNTDDSDILRADRTSNNPMNWDVVNIDTINELPDLPISGIAVNDNDPDIIWVAFGGFLQDYENEPVTRVFKTVDGGENWTNISGCIPNMAINKIMYYDSGRNSLFVGTDVGVYYIDDDIIANSTETSYDWVNYGQAGPRCMVSDIEINYCGDRLVVSTHGRGLWEVDLPETEPILVGTETWNEDRDITRDVYVTTGNTLTINNAVINFARDKKIVVERGAKLIVDNATLTNICGEFWRGVEVWGNGNESQIVPPYLNLPQHQGIIEMKNNAEISFARVGINLVKRTETGNDLNYTGGIAKIEDALFLNNKRSVAYYSYRNFNPYLPQLTYDNESYFLNNEFIIDQDLPNGERSPHFVSMWQVEGIKFVGNVFENKNSNADHIDEIGDGIVFIDARPLIIDCMTTCSDQFPSPPKNPNTFVNLDRGIYAMRHKSINNFEVEGNVFENCHEAIRSKGVAFPIIVNNEIETGYFPDSKNISRTKGIYLIENSGYTVERNIITLSPNANLGEQYGILVQESLVKKDMGNEQIYFNEVTDLTHAFLADGNNADEFSPSNLNPDGLVFLCNKNSSNNEFDFNIEHGVGIKNQQVYISENFVLHPTGNTFTQSSNINFHIYNTASNPIDYYHDSGIEAPSQSKISPSISLTQINTQDALCIDYYNKLVENPQDDNFVSRNDITITDVRIYRDSLITVKNQEEGENTTKNISARLLLSSGNANLLYNDLLIVSPFIFDDNLDLIFSNTVLSETQKVNVLKEHKEYLQTENGYDRVRASNFTETNKNILYLSSSGNSQKGELIHGISASRSKIDELQASIQQYMIARRDTISTDTIFARLEKVHAVKNALIKAGLFVSHFSDLQIDSMETAINNQYDLDITAETEVEELFDLYKTINGFAGNGQEMHELDSTNQSILLSYSTNENLSGIHAQNILSYFYGWEFNNSYSSTSSALKASHNASRKIEIAQQKSLGQSSEIKVLRNPVIDEIWFSYESPSIYGNQLYVKVIDTKGEVVLEKIIKQAQGEYGINIADRLSGLYYLSISINTKKPEIFSIIKQ